VSFELPTSLLASIALHATLVGVAIVSVVETPAPVARFEAREERVVQWQPQTVYVPDLPAPIEAPAAAVPPEADVAPEPVEPTPALADAATQEVEPAAEVTPVAAAAEPTQAVDNPVPAEPTLPAEAIGRSSDGGMPAAAPTLVASAATGTSDVAAQPSAPSATSEAGTNPDHAAHLRAYSAQIRQLASTTFEYPLRARRLGLEGRVVVAVRVDRRGRVVEIIVRESSGHEILDEAAIAAARAIDFPAPPEGFDYAQAAIELPYVYRAES
jgi:protein TonB